MRDDLVARIHQRQRRIEKRLFAADGQQHFGGRDRHAVVRLVAGADRLAELRDARHGGVAREVGVDGRLPRLLDVIRRREVGLADAEVDDVVTGAAETLRLGGHLHGGGLGHLR